MLLLVFLSLFCHQEFPLETNLYQLFDFIHSVVFCFIFQELRVYQHGMKYET